MEYSWLCSHLYLHLHIYYFWTSLQKSVKKGHFQLQYPFTTLPVSTLYFFSIWCNKINVQVTQNFQMVVDVLCVYCCSQHGWFVVFLMYGYLYSQPIATIDCLRCAIWVSKVVWHLVVPKHFDVYLALLFIHGKKTELTVDTQTHFGPVFQFSTFSGFCWAFLDVHGPSANFHTYRGKDFLSKQTNGHTVAVISV